MIKGNIQVKLYFSYDFHTADHTSSSPVFYILVYLFFVNCNSDISRINKNLLKIYVLN